MGQTADERYEQIVRDLDTAHLHWLITSHERKMVHGSATANSRAKHEAQIATLRAEIERRTVERPRVCGQCRERTDRCRRATRICSS